MLPGNYLQIPKHSSLSVTKTRAFYPFNTSQICFSLPGSNMLTCRLMADPRGIDNIGTFK